MFTIESSELTNGFVSACFERQNRYIERVKGKNVSEIERKTHVSRTKAMLGQDNVGSHDFSAR